MQNSILRQKKYDKQYVLRLPNVLFEKLDSAAKKRNKPLSDLIRELLEEYSKTI